MSSGLGNKEVLSRNLQRYIAASGKTRNQICEEMHVHYTTFCGWVNGRSYPEINNIERLADYFHIRKSDLVEDPEATGQNASVSGRLIPIYTSMHGAERKKSADTVASRDAVARSIGTICGKAFVQVDVQDPARYVGIRITDESMSPRFFPGDTAIVRSAAAIPDGAVAAVRLENELLCRRLFQVGSQLFLVPTNPSFPAQKLAAARVQILGEVIEVRGKLTKE